MSMVELAWVRAGRSTRVIALLCATALLGALPAIALGAGSTSTVAAALPDSTSPFSPGVPATPVPTTTTTATTPVVSTSSSSSGGGLSGESALFIAIGALIVLGGIAYFIWHDARRHAPVSATDLSVTAGGRSGSKAPPKSRKLSAAERRRRKRGRAR
jgi:hypothetical protein